MKALSRKTPFNQIREESRRCQKYEITKTRKWISETGRDKVHSIGMVVRGKNLEASS